MTTPTASTPTNAAERALAEGEKLGWTIVSVKDDWSTVF